MSCPRICAVIVTFDRIGELKKILDSLYRQTLALENIIIVNNYSKDRTREYLKELSLRNQNLIVINMEENTGGAGGFAAGMEAADTLTNCEWVWLMDDDGRPSDAEALGV